MPDVIAATRPKAFIPLEKGRRPSFSAALASAVSSNPSKLMDKQSGLTASDYLKRASHNATIAFYKNSPIRNGSLTSSRPDLFFNAFHPLKKTRSEAGLRPETHSAAMGAYEPSSINKEKLIADSIKQAAKQYKLPEKLIQNVIRAESNFRADAVSPAGAQGLMQLMPATAKELGVEDPFDVRQNIDGGARYLRQMLNRFGGDIRLALAAYNAGPGTVIKYNGNVPYRETQTYIKKILKDISA